MYIVQHNTAHQHYCIIYYHLFEPRKTFEKCLKLEKYQQIATAAY